MATAYRTAMSMSFSCIRWLGNTLSLRSATSPSGSGDLADLHDEVPRLLVGAVHASVHGLCLLVGSETRRVHARQFWALCKHRCLSKEMINIINLLSCFSLKDLCSAGAFGCLACDKNLIVGGGII